MSHQYCKFKSIPSAFKKRFWNGKKMKETEEAEFYWSEARLTNILKKKGDDNVPESEVKISQKPKITSTDVACKRYRRGHIAPHNQKLMHAQTQ